MTSEHEVEAQLYEDVAREYAEHLEEILKLLAPGWVPLGYEPLSDSEFLDVMLQRPTPENKMTGTDPVDLPFLMDKNYGPMVSHGLASPPLSPWWLDMMVIPDAFEFFQNRLIRLYHAREKAIDEVLV